MPGPCVKNTPCKPAHVNLSFPRSEATPLSHTAHSRSKHGSLSRVRVTPSPDCSDRRLPKPDVYGALQIAHVLWTEGLWQSCVKRDYQQHFPNSICSLHVSVSHFGNSWNISKFFIIFVMVISDYDLLKARMTVSIFSNILKLRHVNFLDVLLHS